MLSNAEPKKVFQYFSEICQIPHGSGNEKAIAEYLVKFANERNLEVIKDEWLNVIIKKSGTKGYENSPTVILQGHTDMVCEKNESKIHDFKKDPIKLVVEGDIIRADDTTLGADNGIAVAYGLALLDANDISHPPIELVFTSEEEVGLIGATNLDPNLLKGKIFLNMDTEEEGFFVTSCAGGCRVKINLPIKYDVVSKEYNLFQLKISGLKGGHSGMEINKERANANVLIGRTLGILFKKYDISFGDLHGGIKENAIPREAKVVISCKQSDLNNIKNDVINLQAMYRNEYKVSDKNIELVINNYSDSAKIFNKETCSKVIKGIVLCPNGINAMSLDIPELVETSSNLGVITTFEDTLVYQCSVRSSVESKKAFLIEKIDFLADDIGAKIEQTGDYPGWEYSHDSKVRAVFIEAYREQYGEEPILTAIHAGLECGLFSKKIPGLDVISFGPDIFNAHTPQECMSITSVKNVWNMLVSALAKMK
jgi:dipeptidase D